MGRASEEGLESVATEVLAPHFRKTPVESRKVSNRSFMSALSLLNKGMGGVCISCTDLGPLVRNQTFVKKSQRA